MKRPRPVGWRGIPERHLLKIARANFKMPPEMAAVLGGPTPEQARSIIITLTGRDPGPPPGGKKNPRRSPRGLKVSRGDLGAGFRCVSCNRKLGQLHGVNCRIGKKNPRRRAAKRTAKRRKVVKDFPITLIGDAGYEAKKRETIRRLLAGRGKKNPLLGIFGANPRARVVRELGRVVEVRYKRKDDGGLYFHKYSSKPRLLALSDGSIWIKGA